MEHIEIKKVYVERISDDEELIFDTPPQLIIDQQYLLLEK